MELQHRYYVDIGWSCVVIATGIQHIIEVHVHKGRIEIFETWDIEEVLVIWRTA